jgi:hypothetical protein
MDPKLKEELLKQSSASIKLAHGKAVELVPVLGAGTSIDLGLPSWDKLLSHLSEHYASKPFLGRDYPDKLEAFESQLGTVQFSLVLQQLIQTDPNLTTLTLQALISSGTQKLISTNLDSTIEVAFMKAGKPLLPQNVFRGPQEVNAFLSNLVGPNLFKLHGAIERPNTWVLTRRQYNEAYQSSTSPLRVFWMELKEIPLFIGSSLSDIELIQSLRPAVVQKNKPTFALLHVEEVPAMQDLLRGLGVIPLCYVNYEQIPEIIDDIFRCQSYQVKVSRLLGSPGQVEINIGAATVPLTVTSDVGSTALEVVLANAVEFQPMKSLIDGLPRRTFGDKGQYKSDLADLLRDEANDRVISAILIGISQYSDVFLHGCVPSILGMAKANHYHFLELLFDVVTDSFIRDSVKSYLLDNYRNADLTYSSLRSISSTLARLKLHPALELPFDRLTLPRLRIPLYPLTRAQVGLIRDDDTLKAVHPLRPYLLKSLEEIDPLLADLSNRTGIRWQLPTMSEWEFFSGITEARQWPWGDDFPERGIHAHLDFVGSGGAWTSSAVEVGLFPKGRSDSGLYDLIGNIYEIVLDDTMFNAHGPPHYRLAGGGWTSKVRELVPFKLFGSLGRGKDNVGLRPVSVMA